MSVTIDEWVAANTPELHPEALTVNEMAARVGMHTETMRKRVNAAVRRGELRKVYKRNGTRIVLAFIGANDGC